MAGAPRRLTVQSHLSEPPRVGSAGAGSPLPDLVAVPAAQGWSDAADRARATVPGLVPLGWTPLTFREPRTAPTDGSAGVVDEGGRRVPRDTPTAPSARRRRPAPAFLGGLCTRRPEGATTSRRVIVLASGLIVHRAEEVSPVNAVSVPGAPSLRTTARRP
ncbi:hypothetical protein CCE02nite_31000 [Cellulosimicrobium cellulans]|uniref:Uncharacterized protein n=1 Tax=Cellulosimicrobium cellulans TaxID=1710 RepID=A0A4Y4E8Y3_CELCE|nr:hypothetical protein CCE02nite_31000 [Cellulosimicrobium cellulans]